MQRRFQLCRMEAERPGSALVYHFAGAVDQEHSIRPSGVLFLDPVIDTVDEGRKADSQGAHAAVGNLKALPFGPRSTKDYVVADVTGHLPDVAGVGLFDVDGVEGNAA